MNEIFCVARGSALASFNADHVKLVMKKVHDEQYDTTGT
jgi:hypothetical protein